MNVAIIPARGGSKRIPRKNVKSFCGKPMIAHSIENALASRAIDRVIVSTDDDEIAQIAQDFGADVPFVRPAELSDDHTGTSPVIRHAIETLQEQSWNLEYCACIYATSPLLTSELIDRCYDMLVKQPRPDYVFTAARYSFPIQRALVLSQNGGVKPFDERAITQRSQDLEPTYHDAGQLYWGHLDSWQDVSKHIFGENSKMVVMPDHLVQDIDTQEDWVRAELLYQLIQHNQTS